MCRLRKTFLLVVLVMLMVSVVYADQNVNSLNARFPHFQEAENIIHIFVFNDHGRPGQPPAIVTEGDVIILGYEWAGSTIDEILDEFLDNRDAILKMRVDNGSFISVKSYHQAPFIAASQSGPRWSWDHDGDGPGDGDGDGIGDWTGAVSFFRYAVSGLSVGTHTFEFEIAIEGVQIDYDLITVEVVAP